MPQQQNRAVTTSVLASLSQDGQGVSAMCWRGCGAAVEAARLHLWLGLAGTSFRPCCLARAPGRRHTVAVAVVTHMVCGLVLPNFLPTRLAPNRKAIRMAPHTNVPSHQPPALLATTRAMGRVWRVTGVEEADGKAGGSGLCFEAGPPADGEAPPRGRPEAGMDEHAQRQLVLTEQNRQLAAQAAAVREELAASEARVQAAREESSSYVETLTLVARCVAW